jgi:hypothetical protein
MINILRYSGFLLEKFLLESNVVYSNKFKKVLEKMPDNYIAKNLLEIEDKDLEVSSNFFDVKIDSDEVITFSNDRSAQRILKPEHDPVRWTGHRGAWLTNSETNMSIFSKMGYFPTVGSPVYTPNREEIGSLISTWISPKTNKTWAYVKFSGGEGVYNKERLINVSEEELKKNVFLSSRQEIRVGRAVRTLLNANGVKYTDAQIEEFVNLFKGTLSVMNDVFSRFEIVEGEELLFWYKRDNYEDPYRGSLGTSCQAVGRRDWLEIYIDNPDTVKLLILKSYDNSDKIVGRSLLWFLEDGKVLMDVIYVNKDADVNVFKEYARSKNWIISQGNYSDTWKAVTKVKPQGYDSYPSIDTMRYWNQNTGEISNKYFRGSFEIMWDEGGDDDFDPDFDPDDF